MGGGSSPIKLMRETRLFLHPRVEEFCGVMPAALGRYVQESKVLSRFLGLFARPRKVRTDSVFG